MLENSARVKSCPQPARLHPIWVFRAPLQSASTNNSHPRDTSRRQRIYFAGFNISFPCLERNIERQICSNWSNRFGHHAAFEAIRFNASKPTIKTSSKLKSRQLTVAGTCTRPTADVHRYSRLLSSDSKLIQKTVVSLHYTGFSVDIASSFVKDGPHSAKQYQIPVSPPLHMSVCPLT